jgi:hypothetical protein
VDKDFNFGDKAVEMRGPIVYINRPAYYVVVEEEDRLQEWERELRKRFNLEFPLRPGEQGTYSLCDSTYFSEACDSDQI